jgi:arylsulfatase
MKGLLDGSSNAIYADDEFIGGEMGGGKWMRQGDFKAALVPKPYGTGVWQLFNMAEDPG